LLPPAPPPPGEVEVEQANMEIDSDNARGASTNWNLDSNRCINGFLSV